MALEQLSVHTDENLFILGDYHYESFLHHLSNLAIVHPAHLQVVRETLAPLRKEPQFGDFDLLMFHPHCGVIVVGLCSVNSNSDVQVRTRETGENEGGEGGDRERERREREREVIMVGLCSVNSNSDLQVRTRETGVMKWGGGGERERER